MLYIPQNSKFKKFHKGKRLFRLQNNLNILHINKTLLLRSTEPGRLNSRQIITLKQSINKLIKKRGKNFIKIFPNIGISKKPREIRMGKGKGAVEYWAAVVKPGRIMFEVGGVPLSVAKEALRLAAQKLPVKTKFVVARDFEA